MASLAPGTRRHGTERRRWFLNFDRPSGGREHERDPDGVQPLEGCFGQVVDDRSDEVGETNRTDVRIAIARANGDLVAVHDRQRQQRDADPAEIDVVLEVYGGGIS